MQPLVVDLFHGDLVQDFAQVKAAGIAGVIHKATQGASVVDSKYEWRRKAATDAGLLWGAYHFNTGEDVKAQLKNFVNAANPAPDTLMALDFEDNIHSNMSLDQAREFMIELDAKLGRTCVLYSGNRIKTLLPHPDRFFGAHRLWLCQYGPKAKLPASWQNYFLWQYTGDGIGMPPHSVPGISTQGIDLNVFNGTTAQLKQVWA